MAISLAQNFYKEQITSDWTTGAGNFYVSALPDNTSGYLVISPNNPALREVVRYTAIGTDGGGNFVTIAADGRGLGNTNDVAHITGEPVFINVTAQHLEEIDAAIEAINTNGALPASDTTQGTVKVSVPADTPSDPVALGENDPRVPSAKGGDFLATVTGMMIPFAGRVVPTGFLLCDGQAVTPAAQPDLYEAIRNDYGLGVGEEVTFENATDLITRVGHGYSDGDRFFISSTGGNIPTGFTADVAYFVVNSTPNNFQLSNTSGGVPVDFSDNGTGTLFVHPEFLVPNLIGRAIVSQGIFTYRLDLDTTTQIDTNPLGVLTRSSNATSDSINQMYEPGTTNVNAFKLGDQIMLNTSSYSNLSANTIYYAIPTGTAVRFATSYANAESNSFIQLSSQSISSDVHRPAVFDLGNTFTGLIEDGTEVELSAGDGTLPANLPAGTYYVIKVGPTSFKLTDTLVKAQAQQGALLGQTTFGVDNGTGTIKLVIQGNQYVLGQDGGSEYVTLTEDQMPSHVHTTAATTNNGDNVFYTQTTNDTSGDADGAASSGLDPAGGDAPHENRSPFVVAKYIIKT